MLAIMTAIVRVQKFMTASLTVRLFVAISVVFLKVGQFAHDALAELYSTSGDFVKRTSALPPTGSQHKMKKIGSQQPLIGLLVDGTWVAMATVHFAAVTEAPLAACMAVWAKG
jgi:hypothetical protein